MTRWSDVPVPCESKFFDLSDVRMHVITAGSGPSVLLLHGWPQTWYEWRHVIPLLAGQYRLIVPDLRGLGDTSFAANGYEKKHAARDIAELCRALGITSAHLVGHDWGGPVAYSVALQWPELVQTLTIVDVVIPGDGRAGGMAQGGKRWHHAFHQTPHLPEALTIGRERDYLAWFYGEYAEAPVVDKLALDEFLRCYSRPGGMAAGFEYYRAAPQDAEFNSRLLADCGKLRVPVLTVSGGAGRGRVEETAASVMLCADTVESYVLPGCGHLVPEERPQELAELLAGFFGQAR
jgi:pimeloyl-ACP methyl ester carboxylesterase